MSGMTMACRVQLLLPSHLLLCIAALHCSAAQCAAPARPATHAFLTGTRPHLQRSPPLCVLRLNWVGVSTRCVTNVQARQARPHGHRRRTYGLLLCESDDIDGTDTGACGDDMDSEVRKAGDLAPKDESGPCSSAGEDAAKVSAIGLDGLNAFATVPPESKSVITNHEEIMRIGQAWALIFNYGLGNEGIYARHLSENGRDLVLLFVEDEAAVRYRDMLAANDFPEADIVLVDTRELLSFCAQSGHLLGVVRKGGVLIPPEENVERFQWSPGMSAEALAAETAALLLEQQQEQLDVAADGDGVHGGDDGDGVHGGDDGDCRGGGRSSRSGAGIGSGDGAGANAGADAHVGGERRGFAEGSGAPGGSVASLREDRGKCDADMAKEPTGAAATAGLDGRGGGGHDDGGAADDGVVCDADADSNGSRRRGEAGEQAEAARRLHEQRQALEALFAQDGGAEGSL